MSLIILSREEASLGNFVFAFFLISLDFLIATKQTLSRLTQGDEENALEFKLQRMPEEMTSALFGASCMAWLWALEGGSQ
jgi:hypothetical protein